MSVCGVVGGGGGSKNLFARLGGGGQVQNDASIMSSKLWRVKHMSIYDDSDDKQVLSLIHRKLVENVREKMKI